MLITRETDYAVRLLRALNGQAQVQKAADLSKTEQIPPQFIYKILKKLQIAGLVEIRAGVQGGCRLIADLSTYNLLDLLHAMGDKVLVNACTTPGYRCKWEEGKGCRCHAHTCLANLQKSIEDQLRAVTLDHLCIAGLPQL